MKEWLLPIYNTFLWCFVMVYASKATDIAVAIGVYHNNFQSGMPIWFAIIHSATFWTSGFWLFDLLFFFMASNSHGTIAIRRAFWMSTFLWVINTFLCTRGMFCVLQTCVISYHMCMHVCMYVCFCYVSPIACKTGFFFLFLYFYV